MRDTSPAMHERHGAYKDIVVDSTNCGFNCKWPTMLLNDAINSISFQFVSPCLFKWNFMRKFELDKTSETLAMNNDLYISIRNYLFSLFEMAAVAHTPPLRCRYNEYYSYMTWFPKRKRILCSIQITDANSYERSHLYHGATFTTHCHIFLLYKYGPHWKSAQCVDLTLMTLSIVLRILLTVTFVMREPSSSAASPFIYPKVYENVRVFC